MSGYRTGYTLRPRSLNVRPEVVEAALELCLKALGGADKYCVNGMAHSYSLISPMHLAPEEPDRARKGQGARRLSNEVQLGKVACGPGSVDEPRPPRAAKSGVLVGFTLRQVCYETLLPPCERLAYLHVMVLGAPDPAPAPGACHSCRKVAAGCRCVWHAHSDTADEAYSLTGHARTIFTSRCLDTHTVISSLQYGFPLV